MNLISGATGFIGRRLFAALAAEQADCRLLVRQAVPWGACHIGDLADYPALLRACAGIDTLFHCAGWAHAFSARSPQDAQLYWRINHEGTCNLLAAAAQAGVRRFVFLSSVKAMAEPGESCVDEDWPGEADTDYGRSKRAAEEAVLNAGKEGMHVVNLRLTMVYGRGGRGNLERMGSLVRRGWFPPLPETGNHRSMVHVDDAIRAMRLAAGDPRANGRTYIVAGSEAPSGRELFAAMRQVLGLPRCQYAVPQTALLLAARAADRLEALLQRRLPFDSEVLARLLGSAWYSAERIRQELGWRPQVSLHDGLREMFGYEAAL